MWYADAREARACEIAVRKFDGLRAAAAASAVHPTAAMTGGRRVKGGGEGARPRRDVLCQSTNPQGVVGFTFSSSDQADQPAIGLLARSVVKNFRLDDDFGDQPADGALQPLYCPGGSVAAVPGFDQDPVQA
jgi:hypothetical protein